jgi:hypothetical protein
MRFDHHRLKPSGKVDMWKSNPNIFGGLKTEDLQQICAFFKNGDFTRSEK